MAAPIERNVMDDISRLACRAAMASRPDTPAVASWGEPVATKTNHAPDNTIRLLNRMRVILLHSAPRPRQGLTEWLFDDTLLSKAWQTRHVKEASGNRPAVPKGKHQFTVAASAVARRNVRI